MGIRGFVRIVGGKISTESVHAEYSRHHLHLRTITTVKIVIAQCFLGIPNEQLAFLQGCHMHCNKSHLLHCLTGRHLRLEPPKTAACCVFVSKHTFRYVPCNMKNMQLPSAKRSALCFQVSPWVHIRSNIIRKFVQKRL